MVGLAGFFGRDEWKAMFLASSLLSVITLVFILFRVVLYVALAIFLLAFLFTGFKLFFDKKKGSKAKFDGDDLMSLFKK